MSTPRTTTAWVLVSGRSILPWYIGHTKRACIARYEKGDRRAWKDTGLDCIRVRIKEVKKP